MDNQVSQTLAHLKAYGTITSMVAFQRYGITRLADKVLKLRQRGYHIETIMTEGVNRFGRRVKFATYKYIGEDK